MMAPIDKVRMLYTEDSPRTFEEDLSAHLYNGYVFSTYEYLLMARPVWSGAPQDAINDVWCAFAPLSWDTWYVYAFALRYERGLAGLVKKLLTHMPFYLPLTAWERSGESLTFHATDKLFHKYAKLHPQSH